MRRCWFLMVLVGVACGGCTRRIVSQFSEEESGRVYQCEVAWSAAMDEAEKLFPRVAWERAEYRRLEGCSDADEIEMQAWIREDLARGETRLAQLQTVGEQSCFPRRYPSRR